MKLIVGYDGSDCSETALDDLARAGLPETGEILVLSVAEVWLPPQNSEENDDGIKLDAHTEEIIHKYQDKGKKAVAEADELANQAKQRLQRILPDWTIKAEASYGSPAWEILTRAEDFKPDLIVVGSQGRSAISRFILGSISQKILTEAHCSVRVARGRVEADPTPMRVFIGFDSSNGAKAAVEAVAARNWSEQSEIRLVSVTDPVTPSTIGRFIPPITRMVEEINQAEREWLEKLAENSLEKLRNAGLTASFHIYAGNPKQKLVEEAENWNADCIFVGANAFGSRIERFLIGSTSAAIAARAHCSVEVVRRNA